MVGVPHSTGCALCRERRIKVNMHPTITSSYRANKVPSATRQSRSAASVGNMVVPVRATGEPSASKTKAPTSLGDTAPTPDGRGEAHRLAKLCPLHRQPERTDRPPHAKTPLPLQTWCAATQLPSYNDTPPWVAGMKKCRRPWCASRSVPHSHNYSSTSSARRFRPSIIIIGSGLAMRLGSPNISS